MKIQILLTDEAQISERESRQTKKIAGHRNLLNLLTDLLLAITIE
jgi:hypothetical protein